MFRVVSFVVFDVTDSKAVNSAVESILKTHKRIDVVVNNSGRFLFLNRTVELKFVRSQAFCLTLAPQRCSSRKKLYEFDFLNRCLLTVGCFHS